MSHKRSQERVKTLELILRQKKIDVPRDSIFSTPSPYLRKRDMSPHEMYIPSNYVTEMGEDDRESDASDFLASNFEEYQTELDQNIGTSPPRFAQSSTK